MPRFVFRLQPLLEARKLDEEAAQRRVAEIQRERLQLEGMLRRHQRSITDGKQVWREELLGRIDLDALRLGANASLHLQRKAQQVVLMLAGVHSRLQTARARLIEATKRRRAIELLRDRRFEQFKAALAKAETAALDELAVNRFARKEIVG